MLYPLFTLPNPARLCIIPLILPCLPDQPFPQSLGRDAGNIMQALALVFKRPVAAGFVADQNMGFTEIKFFNYISGF